MVSQTNEQALESTIERCLVGISTEELKGGLSPSTPVQGMSLVLLVTLICNMPLMSVFSGNF